MGLVTRNQNRTFIGIANGKITHRVKNAEGQFETETFDGIEGTLKAINTRKASINNKEMEFVDLIIADGGEEFDLSIPLQGGVARSLIMSLASIQSFVGRVAINPYLAKDGEHTNLAVTFNGQKVGWVVSMAELPKIETVTLPSGDTVQDGGKRDRYIRDLLTGVQQRVAAAQATPQAAAAPAPEAEDLPGEDMPGDGSFFEGVAGEEDM